MNMIPVYGVNTVVVFTPPAYIHTREIANAAVAADCWVQIRGSGSSSSIRVAGPLDRIERLATQFSVYLMNCFDGRCDKSVCHPEECNFLPPAGDAVQVMINASGMPL
jgi:hypothetical protein